MARIGFIGLGLMGAAFTRRLAAAGHEVTGSDLDPAKLDAARCWGVAPARSPAEAAERADVVGLCVTTSDAVRAVVAGPQGLVAAGGLAGKTVVDFSTTEISVTQSVASALTEAGAAFLDAPVSGGPAAAEAGTLAIMVGGEPAAFEAVRPLLALFGHTTHMGPVGAGQATKLVNQALCLTNYCVVAEGLRLAEAYGVDTAKIPAALAPGLANSAVLQSVFPRMAARDYEPRGYARQVLKDLEMLQEAAKAHHLAMPMAAQATTLFRLLVAGGQGERDGAAVVTLIPEPRQG